MIQHQGRQLQVRVTSLQYDPVNVQTDRSATTSSHHQIQHTRDRCKFDNIKKYNIHFFDSFHTFFYHFLFLLIAAINTTSTPSENRENEP